MGQPVHILVVEDSLLVAMALEHALIDAGYLVTVVDSNAAARAAATRDEFAAALVDYHLPDGVSVDLCAELRSAGIAVALVTGLGRDSAEPLRTLDRVFYKPVEEQALLAWLAELTD